MPIKSARLQIQLNTGHRRADIDHLVDVLRRHQHFAEPRPPFRRRKQRPPGHRPAGLTISVTPASSMSWRCRRVRSSGSHRLTPELVATAAEVAIAMLKRRVAPHQAEGWSNPRAWTILDARGRSPNVRSSSQPIVRPRSRGSLPRLPYVRIAYIVAEVALVAPELMSHPARSHHHRTRGGGR